MRRDIAIPILAIIFFGIGIILTNYGNLMANVFTGGGFVTLGVHRKLFYKRGKLSQVIPAVLMLLGLYFIVSGVFGY